MKFSMWFVTVTTFAVGISFGTLLPVLQELLYTLLYYLQTGFWGPSIPC